MRSDQIKRVMREPPGTPESTGVRDEDFAKPFIAIVNSYVDIVPGHVHLQGFGRRIKEAVRAAGACL
jgi:dihydroxy-acid dehydratase